MAQRSSNASNASNNSDASDASSDDDDLYLDVRAATSGSTSDVFLAARLGDTARLASILAADPEAVGARDLWSATALYYAALCGHLEAVNLLREAGALCVLRERECVAAKRARRRKER